MMDDEYQFNAVLRCTVREDRGEEELRSGEAEGGRILRFMTSKIESGYTGAQKWESMKAGSRPTGDSSLREE